MGKIYKVEFDDGHYYFGSTTQSLETRFRLHKYNMDTQCSRYMQKVGKDACRIVLVEDYPCENKQQLLRKEDEYIQRHRDEEMCLNIKRSFVEPNETEEKRYFAEYYEAHKEELMTKARAYHNAHKEEISIKRKAQYHAKKQTNALNSHNSS
jgi:hypothetical protein